MTYHFIVNPEAGEKISDKVIEIVEAYALDHPTFEYTLQLTQKAKHGTQLASEIKSANDIIISVGGDGSTFDVVNGIQPGVKLGIIPAGTGNDLFRMIGLPKNYSLKEILIETIEGKSVTIDCGQANELKYINSLNVGLDVDVLLEYDEMRARRPWSAKLIYIMAAIKVLLRYKTFKFDFEIDGQKGPNELILLTMMNGKYYGGGFKPTPEASLQDGHLDTCFVERLPLWKVLYLFVLYRGGKHRIDKRVHVQPFAKIVIDSQTELAYGCDGEVHYGKHIEVSIIKDGLNLLVPKVSVLK